MKKIILLIPLLLGITAIKLAAEPNKDLITINQFAQHPALDAVVEGFEQGLKEANLLDKIELIKKNAQGNMALAIQIAQNFASLNPKVMLAIATPSTQTTLKARNSNTKSLVAFGAVSSPNTAILEAQNVVGVTDLPPLAELLDIMALILPKSKNIGVIYNPSELNSVSTINQLKELAAKRRLVIIEAVVNNTSDLASATASLMGKVDIIYLPQDNTVASGITTIANITYKQTVPIVKNFADNTKVVPLINNDPSLVEKGIFLSLGCDYLAVGKQLSATVVKRLNNQDTSNTIVNASKKQLLINHNLAKEWNITIPTELTKLMENK